MWLNPDFFRLKHERDRLAYDLLIKENNPQILDTIESQLAELVHCQNPSLSKTEIKEKRLVDKKLKEEEVNLNNYGVWVYYSWKNQLVHILDEEEFIEVRTNRNKYKITHEEQEILRSKKIGVIGLSVGRAVATTLALERIAGEIRLADFDDLELSNLNRIKAPISELGVNKTISTAHEILEIDPFIKVKCFVDGLTEANMDTFFQEDGNLDLLVEECDDIAMKIESRLKAKKLQIPVVMETNDNSIIDIERFDLEPDREIFHGRLTTIDQNLSDIPRKVFINALFHKDELSKRMIFSISKLNEDIITWPQIASETFAGAGNLTKIIREILCGLLMDSGRKVGFDKR